MSFGWNHYVPCLPWKQGEYQAILELGKAARSFITPLIEVPEIGFDFETRSESKSIDEHLQPFAKRVFTKWGTSLCFVDVVRISPDKRMADDKHPLSFIFDGLREKGCAAVPVTGVSRDQQSWRATKRILTRDGRGIGIRLKIEEAARPRVKAQMDDVLSTIGIEAEHCDLILDLGAPNFEPLDGFTKMIEALTQKVPYLNLWRTFTLIGTSFPSTMAEIKRNMEVIPRWEWELYKRLAEILTRRSLRLPTFGDYCISHPDQLSMDMRLVKPSATIRYTTDAGWLIVKGSNVRDNGYDQFRMHCQTILNSTNYMGSSFSQGDKYIKGCAAGTVGTGNLTTWRKVGTNHHIKKVVQDISSLFGPSVSI